MGKQAGCGGGAEWKQEEQRRQPQATDGEAETKVETVEQSGLIQPVLEVGWEGLGG